MNLTQEFRLMNKEGWKFKTRGSPDHALLTWLFIYSLGSSMWCLIKRNFIHISVSENCVRMERHRRMLFQLAL